MLSSVEQAFVGRDKKRAPLKTPAWEASFNATRNVKKVKLDFGFITIYNIFNIRGTNIYDVDVFIAHRNDI